MKIQPETCIPLVVYMSQSEGLKRKRDDPISMEHLFQCLQTKTKTPRESSPISQEHARLLDNFAKNPIFPKFQNLNEMKSFFELFNYLI